MGDDMYLRGIPCHHSLFGLRLFFANALANRPETQWDETRHYATLRVVLLRHLLAWTPATHQRGGENKTVTHRKEKPDLQRPRKSDISVINDLSEGLRISDENTHLDPI